MRYVQSPASRRFGIYLVAVVCLALRPSTPCFAQGATGTIVGRPRVTPLWKKKSKPTCSPAFSLISEASCQGSTEEQMVLVTKQISQVLSIHQGTVARLCRVPGGAE